MKDYRWSIEQDLAAQEVDGPLLQSEVSNAPGLTATLHHVDTDGDTLILWFEQVLGGDQWAIVDRHVRVHLSHRKLYLEEEFAQGRITKRTWYARVDDDGVLSQKVEEASFTYLGALITSEVYSTYGPDGTELTREVFDYTNEDLGSGKTRVTRARILATSEGLIATAQSRFHGSATILRKSEQVTETDWALLGGIVTTPEFFGPVTSLKTRIVGSFKATGAGAEMRLVEDGSKVIGSIVLPDTAGAWQTMQWFSTEPASVGTHEYALEAKTGSATDVYAKFVSMSLLEFYT